MEDKPSKFNTVYNKANSEESRIILVARLIIFFCLRFLFPVLSKIRRK